MIKDLLLAWTFLLRYCYNFIWEKIDIFTDITIMKIWLFFKKTMGFNLTKCESFVCIFIEAVTVEF